MTVAYLMKNTVLAATRAWQQTQLAQWDLKYLPLKPLEKRRDEKSKRYNTSKKRNHGRYEDCEQCSLQKGTNLMFCCSSVFPAMLHC